jgi:hypothetical protein
MMSAVKVGKTPSVKAAQRSDSDIARLSLLVPRNMRSRLESLSDRERRSLNQQCVLVMERGLTAIEAAAA